MEISLGKKLLFCILFLSCFKALSLGSLRCPSENSLINFLNDYGPDSSATVVNCLVNSCNICPSQHSVFSLGNLCHWKFSRCTNNDTCSYSQTSCF